MAHGRFLLMLVLMSEALGMMASMDFDDLIFGLVRVVIA
jgi:hypothetical protein